MKQTSKKLKAEANARRKANKSWKKVENTKCYRSAAIREMCTLTARKIEGEVLDGIFLNLRSKSRERSSNVQNRILRRIVEKRQSQAAHKRSGRSADLFSMHHSIKCTRKCMEAIRKKKYVA